jgi:hypothetical protein
MKKLGKLNIDHEKMIQTSELITLKGGYGDPCSGQDHYYCYYTREEFGAMEDGDACFNCGADACWELEQRFGPLHMCYCRPIWVCYQV